MKQLIYEYHFNNKTYFVEAYKEVDARSKINEHFNASLREGRPVRNIKILKRIWSKDNHPKFRLLFTHKDTTSKSDIRKYKKQQHVMYELNLLLKEDERFLTGTNDIFITNTKNRVQMWYKHIVGRVELGYDMPYSVKGSREEEDLIKVYRFKGIMDAYEYVRNNIVTFGMSDIKYNKNFTLLEMCDSFLAGFGNPDINGKDFK